MKFFDLERNGRARTPEIPTQRFTDTIVVSICPDIARSKTKPYREDGDRSSDRG